MSSGLQSLHLWFRSQDPRLLGIWGGAIVAVLVTVWLVARGRRVSGDELERRRRERLASTGRITDGSLIDARTLENEESSSDKPEVLVYRYRLAGVVYECAQDVSRLPENARNCHVGSAVQVRYDPRNPGDSILLAESWSGLWLPQQLAGEPLPDAVRPPCTPGNS